MQGKRRTGEDHARSNTTSFLLKRTWAWKQSALTQTFKTLRLNQSIALETPDSSIVQDVPSAELLALATPSKSNEKTKRIPKERINEENYIQSRSLNGHLLFLIAFTANGASWTFVLC